MKWTDKDQAIVDAKMYRDTAEAEVLIELRRLGIENSPRPEICSECGGELDSSSGYAGETIIYCPNNKCSKGILWEDAEQAIRNIL